MKIFEMEIKEEVERNIVEIKLKEIKSRLKKIEEELKEIQHSVEVNRIGIMEIKKALESKQKNSFFFFDKEDFHPAIFKEKKQ